MNLDRDPLPVVPNRDRAGILIDGDFHRIHGWITHFVVGSIDKNLVKDLVEARHVACVPVCHLLFRHIIHPHRLGAPLDTTDIGIRTP